MNRVRELTSVLGLVILVSLWWGCAPRTQTATSAPTAQARPRSTATVAILSPAPGAVVRPDERLSWPRTVGLGAQHVVAMFGASFVAPGVHH